MAFVAGPPLCYHPPECAIPQSERYARLKEANVEPVIVLYAKAGCHLCDDARTHLEDLAADFDFTFDEVDIRRDPAIFERYRYRIPVITVDGAERLEGRIEADEIRALVEELQFRHR